MGYFAAGDVRGALSAIMGREIEISACARHLAEFCSPKRGEILQRIGEKRRYRFSNPLHQPYVVMHGISSELTE